MGMLTPLNFILFYDSLKFSKEGSLGMRRATQSAPNLGPASAPPGKEAGRVYAGGCGGISSQPWVSFLDLLVSDLLPFRGAV